MILETKNLTVGYRHRSSRSIILEGLNLSLPKGKIICLLGANGTGKSTLMRSLAGVQPPLDGEIRLEGKNLKQFTSKALSKKISIVLTEKISGTRLSGYQMLSLGRYPYLGWLGLLKEEDYKHINEVVKMLGIASLVKKQIAELSDGERQKVMIARAIVQDTPIIMLDEPTAFLDLPNRVDIMNLLRRIAHQTSKTILMSSHDLELSLQIADIIWLLEKQGTLKTGIPEDLILDGSFERSFADNPGVTFDKKRGTFSIIQECEGTPVSIQGEGEKAFWTERALRREGFTIDKMAPIEIIILDSNKDIFELNLEGKKQVFKTIADVIEKIYIYLKNENDARA